MGEGEEDGLCKKVKLMDCYSQITSTKILRYIS